MNNLYTASLAALLIATGGAAFAQSDTSQSETNIQLSQAECQDLWSRADASGAEKLSPSQADAYISNFSAADFDGDGMLTNAEFMAACEQGLVHDGSATGAGEGTQGEDTPPAPGGSPATRY